MSASSSAPLFQELPVDCQRSVLRHLSTAPDKVRLVVACTYQTYGLLDGPDAVALAFAARTMLSRALLRLRPAAPRVRRRPYTAMQRRRLHHEDDPVGVLSSL